MADNQGSGSHPSPELHREVLLITWDRLKHLVEANELWNLQREPSQLRRYRQWSADIKNEYGSMTTYLLAKRLPQAWGSMPFSPASSVPFQDPSDYKVLLNDWPYGFTTNIAQMVVWTRTPIPTESDDGDMIPASRELISSFVQRYFIDRLSGGTRDQVVWFRNWGALRSVSSIDHIHVIVRDVNPSMIEEWTR